MNYGEKSRQEGRNYEHIIASILKKQIPEACFNIPENDYCLDIFGGTTTTKADIFSTGGGISVKNPGTFSTSIQMAILSKQKLLDFLSVIRNAPEQTKLYTELFLGSKTKAILEENCEKAGILFSSLNYKNETRRQRVLHFSIPKELQNSFDEFINDELIKDSIFDVVMSKGFCKEKQNHAKVQLWSAHENKQEKSSTKNIAIVNLPQLKSQLMNHDFTIQPSGSVWKWGPITLQMKGSGAKSGSGYHSPQFNASLKALLDYCPEDSYCIGNPNSVSIKNKLIDWINIKEIK
tara:strand:- start:272 stop:1147 length:876 start_codon:yes stop_codon:yes gene_type:complete